MNTEEYLTNIQSFLRVAEPARNDILCELRDHTKDAGLTDEAEQRLGDPATVAGKLNRVHIGILCSRARLFWTPIMVAVFSFAISLLKPSYPLNASSLLSVWEGTAYYCAAAVLLLLPLVAAWMVGKSLARTAASGKEFLFLVFETLVLTVGYQAIRSDYDGILMTMGGLVTVVVCACVAIFSVIATKPVFGSASVVSSRLYLELLFTIFALVFGSFIILGMTEAVFAPFDIALERPPQGTVIRDVNDFFESGAGAYLPAALFAVALIIRLAIRMRQYTRRALTPSIVGLCAVVFGTIVAVLDLASLTAVASLALLVFGMLLSIMGIKMRRTWATSVLMVLVIPCAQLLISFLNPFRFNGFGSYIFIPLLYLPAALLGNALVLLIRYRRTPAMTTIR